MTYIAKAGSLLTLLTFLFLSLTAQEKELIVGKWKFEDFELTDSTAQQYRSTVKDAIKSNTGLIYTITKDGKFTASLPGGNEFQNFEAVYRYYPSRKNLIVEGKDFQYGLTVVHADAGTLKLYNREMKVIMILRKSS